MRKPSVKYLMQGPGYPTLVKINAPGETIHFTREEAAILWPLLKKFAETIENKEQENHDARPNE